MATLHRRIRGPRWPPESCGCINTRCIPLAPSLRTLLAVDTPGATERHFCLLVLQSAAEPAKNGRRSQCAADRDRRSDRKPGCLPPLFCLTMSSPADLSSTSPSTVQSSPSPSTALPSSLLAIHRPISHHPSPTVHRLPSTIYHPPADQARRNNLPPHQVAWIGHDTPATAPRPNQETLPR